MRVVLNDIAYTLHWDEKFYSYIILLEGASSHGNRWKTWGKSCKSFANTGASRKVPYSAG
jgi:hypothetical protein